MIDKIVNLKDKYIHMCQESYLPEQMKFELEHLIEDRIAVLTQ